MSQTDPYRRTAPRPRTRQALLIIREGTRETLLVEWIPAHLAVGAEVSVGKDPRIWTVAKVYPCAAGT